MIGGVPIQITYRNTDLGAAKEREIRSRAARLEMLSPFLEAAQVFVDTPYRRRAYGRHRVQIEMRVSDKALIVSREPEVGTDFENVLTDVFRAARQELESYTRIRERRCSNTSDES